MKIALLIVGTIMIIAALIIGETNIAPTPKSERYALAGMFSVMGGIICFLAVVYP